MKAISLDKTTLQTLSIQLKKRELQTGSLDFTCFTISHAQNNFNQLILAKHLVVSNTMNTFNSVKLLSNMIIKIHQKLNRSLNIL